MGALEIDVTPDSSDKQNTPDLNGIFCYQYPLCVISETAVD